MNRRCELDGGSGRRVWRLGTLRPSAPTPPPTSIDGLSKALREVGCAEGRNLVVERRYVITPALRLQIDEVIE